MKPLLLLALAILPLHAASPERREIEGSFYCFNYVPGLETIHVPAATGSVPVRLSIANISEPVKVPVIDGEAVFQREATPSAAAVKVRIPREIAKALVVLLPAPAGSPEPYRAFVLDRAREKFPLGTYRLVNLSPHAVRGAVGRSFAEAKPGAIAGLELQGEAGETQAVKFEFQQDGRWNRLTESRAAVRRDRRWLVCIYEDPASHRMNLRSIPDRTASESEAPDTATVSAR